MQVRQRVQRDSKEKVGWGAMTPEQKELIQTKYKGYFVDNTGNVWSKKRGKVRKLKMSNHEGYWRVSPYHDGKARSVCVHVLICTAFWGEKPTPLHEVRHLDGNRRNNIPENLRWGTRAENQQDAVRHGTHVMLKISRIKGINAGRLPGTKTKITKNDVIKIKNEYKAGIASQGDIAKKYDVSQSLVSRIINKSRWGDIGE